MTREDTARELLGKMLATATPYQLTHPNRRAWVRQIIKVARETAEDFYAITNDFPLKDTGSEEPFPPWTTTGEETDTPKGQSPV